LCKALRQWASTQYASISRTARIGEFHTYPIRLRAAGRRGRCLAQRGVKAFPARPAKSAGLRSVWRMPVSTKTWCFFLIAPEPPSRIACLPRAASTRRVVVLAFSHDISNHFLAIDAEALLSPPICAPRAPLFRLDLVHRRSRHPFDRASPIRWFQDSELPSPLSPPSA